METEIGKRLSKEVNFGDLVELTLNLSTDYCARHSQSNVIVSPREKGIEYHEREIRYISGYYGGMNDTHFEQKDLIRLQHETGETYVCLDPTLHAKNAVDEIHCLGEGLIKVPISAIASYDILSKNRRGLRVVN